jgi:hypothetical protein
MTNPQLLRRALDEARKLLRILERSRKFRPKTVRAALRSARVTSGHLLHLELRMTGVEDPRKGD